MKVLFVCTHNRMRSRTAEDLCKGLPGVQVKSAGISIEATVRLTEEHIEWADVVIAMTRIQTREIRGRHGHLFAHGKRLVSLEIPDIYAYNDPELVDVLRVRLKSTLGVPL